jgi:mannose-1-phosphate guanylyltransferase/phosphomannomutase
MTNTIKAVVLAGGLGTRLYPLTRKTAKCMLPINGKPLLEHIIKYLAGHGFREIILTVGNKRKQIMDYFGNGAQFGVKLQYSMERKALGTASSFKNVGKLITGTTLVMQGDTLTNFALGEIISFHKKKKAMATIALTSVQNTKGYGVAMIDKNKRIIRFEEKPASSFSNLVNSGIYVLEHDILNYIPKNRTFDFSKDLFPLLLKDKLPLYGIEVSGYWFDIGTSESYKNAREYFELHETN